MIQKFICSMVGHRPALRQYQLTAGGMVHTWECCPRCREHHRPDVQAALLMRVVVEGQLIPAGYGVAWVDWRTGDAAVMPLPLNVAAASALRGWYWVRTPRGLIMDPRQAYAQGYFNGLRHGRRPNDGGGAQ